MRRIAIVEWEDVQAAKDGHGSWLYKEEFDAWCKEPFIVCSSVSYLTFESEEFVVISQSIFGSDVAESTKIPRANITRMTVVDESDFDKIGLKYVRGIERVQQIAMSGGS